MDLLSSFISVKMTTQHGAVHMFQSSNPVAQQNDKTRESTAE